MKVWRDVRQAPCARPTHGINGNHHNNLASWRSGDAADCKSVPRFSHIIMKSNDIRGLAVPGICAAERRTYRERKVNVWQEGKI